MIRGRATIEGTRQLASGRPGYRRLGPTGLTVSLLGFGGYRTGRADPGHRQALRDALRAGVNLIDTSTNYLAGESESLIGEVLAEGIIPREQVVVVSKAGYVQGPNLELAQAREAAGQPFPEMVKYADGLWHCLAPEFLADQIARSRERLDLETIDVFLLHNAEYYLSDISHQPSPPPLDSVRAEFEERLARAFRYLDSAVASGQIGAYGVSSNTCVRPADDPEATSVTRMAAVSEGRLAVLQLPYNLLETGALLERNTPEGTALDAARAHGLGVLVNRPLNAILGHRLARLADPRPVEDAALRARIEALGRTETALGLAVPGAEPPRTAAIFQQHWAEIAAPADFARVMRGAVIPEARRGLGDLVSRPQGETAAVRALVGRYEAELSALYERLQARAQPATDPRLARAIRERLAPHLPAGRQAESLSRLALAFIASTPGVSCVLVGMRDPAYVRDAAGMMGWEPLPNVTELATALNG